MRITSTDGQSWLEILHHGDEAYSSFSLSALVDIGHGRFSGTNSDVQFLNLAEFAAELARFQVERRTTPQLEGTYGSSLRFWCPEGRREILVGIVVGDASAASPVTTELRLEGAFAIDEATLASAVESVQRLAARAGQGPSAPPQPTPTTR